MSASHAAAAPRATLALAAFAAAVLGVHAVLASLSPVVGADWGALMWQASHEGVHGTDLARAFLATHFTLEDAAGYVLVTVPGLHVVLTPLVSLALVVGLFVLARGRLPRRGAWDDVVDLVLLSALVWLAQPRAGLVYFYRTYAATHLYGTTIGVWVVAAYLVPVARRARWVPALFVGGLLAGLASRQVAIATLIGACALTLSAPREGRSWRLAGLLGLVVGTATSLFDRPYISTTAFRRSFEGIGQLLNLPIREGGELVSLVLLLVVARLTLGALVRGPAIPSRSEALPLAHVTLRWLGLWGALCVLALFGPRYNEATLLPSTAVLAVGALPWLSWIASARLLRGVLLALALTTHLVTWATGVRTLRAVHADHAARMAAIASTPPGGIAQIPPYRYLSAGYWFFGEDWAAVGSRQRAGMRLFGLRDIEFAPPFRRLEVNPRVAIRVEIEGLAPAQVAALRSPPLWATDPTTARLQFEDLITRARRRGLAGSLQARLVVDQPPVAGQGERPLLVAWYESGTLVSPHTRRKSLDVSGIQTLLVPPAHALTWTSAFLVADGQVTPLTLENGGYTFSVPGAGVLQVIGCEPTRCVLLDAFEPRL